MNKLIDELRSLLYRRQHNRPSLIKLFFATWYGHLVLQGIGLTTMGIIAAIGIWMVS